MTQRVPNSDNICVYKGYRHSVHAALSVNVWSYGSGQTTQCFKITRC